MSPPPPKRPRHRRFGLSVRAMMALVLILGGGLGWYVERVRIQRDAIAAIVRAGGDAYYQWQVGEDGNFLPAAEPPVPRWLIDRVDYDWFQTVAYVQLGRGRASVTRGLDTSHPELAQVARLSHLRSLDAAACPVTDADLIHLRGLSRLEGLNLNCTLVKGPGLANLEGLTHLKTLVLIGIPLSDADLAHVARLGSLELLILDSPRITDAGLAHLEGLTHLRHLNLRSARITDAGLALKQA